MQKHTWSFYRAGGVDQVQLQRGADILRLDELDLKLWVALSCPVKGLEIDERTLQLLDTDNDAHVRPPEILAAVKWLRETLINADGLANGEDGVDLANLRKDTDEGKALFASAQHILKSLGKKGGVITVADAEKTSDVFSNAQKNGDGIVPPEMLDDADLRRAAEDLVKCTGGALDRSGKLGFDQKQIETFFAACADFDAWRSLAETDPQTVMPFGESTESAYAAFAAVRAKIDDYFGRCRLAAFDPRALTAVNREQEAYMAAAAKDLTITASEVAHFPLARIEPGMPMPLSKNVNPAWADALAAFSSACCAGKDAIDDAQWAALCKQLDAHAAWMAKKAGAIVEPLGIERVRELLAGSARAALEAAVADDLAVAPDVDAMARVEKLARLHRDFATLLNNYVSFSDFYSRKGAIFQAGTLFLDGRELDLCFAVNDAGKHATLAAMAKSYLAYVDCTRPGSPKMQVACAFTAGESDNLFVGRNGIFYDRKGRDWNATIVKIVDNPISIRQAFWSPYKKLVRWIEETVAKRAAEADTQATAKLQTVASKAGEAAATGKAPVDAAPKKMDIGVLAAISVAISGITAIVGTVLEKFFDLGYLMPLGAIGVVLLISGPSMVIAWMKLRQRNLGPILDANGWAVNTLTKVNIPLGSSLTALATLPKGASRSLVDPFAEKKSAWPKVVLALAILGALAWTLYRTNVLHQWLPSLVPQHHVETSLQAPTHSVAPGATIVLNVRSGDDELEVYENKDGGKLLMKLAVKDGKAELTIPADAKPAALIVRDSASPSEVEIEVTAPAEAGK